MANAILADEELPPFDKIQASEVVEAVDVTLEENRALLDKLSKLERVSWQNFIAPLEELEDRLKKRWSSVSHLNAVMNSDELREVYNLCLPKLSNYYTELGQNQALFRNFKKISQSEQWQHLTQTQKKYIEDCLRDFRLSGVDLEPESKKRYKEINQRLSKLSSQFPENVLDATQAWEKVIQDADELKGLPDTALESAQQAASTKNKSGYLINLEFPSYFPVITYCENRALRKEIYTAFVTRASDQGPNPNTWDNSEIIDEILKLRHEQSLLVGFKNYAEKSLALKMAGSVEEVINFLNQLVEKSLPFAKKEFAELKTFAAEQLGLEELEPWDIAFASEKLRQKKYALSQEELRPYFPVDKVISGMFEISKRLYQIEIVQVEDVVVWHKDVKVYRLMESSGEVIALFYLDLYARENKRGGAWMDECRVRRRKANGMQLPVAYLTCNFTPPVAGKPALLTHNEVTTLFHEFGHGLHHMLTQVDVAGVSGINGVPWDAVELPSQFFENWCWQSQALPLISSHYESGESLPDGLLQKLLSAKNFQSGMQMLRQIEFALFDFKVHAEYTPGQPKSVQLSLDEVRRQVSVVPIADFNRFQHSFSHIFAGGYAAGYYSYKWAEVLSADAFSRFEEEGIFNSETGLSFKQNILQAGGAQAPAELFVQFRGREPQVDALLRHNGLA